MKGSCLGPCQGDGVGLVNICSSWEIYHVHEKLGLKDFFYQVELRQVGLKRTQLVIWVLWIQPELITKQQTMYLLYAWFIKSINYWCDKWIIGTVKTPKQVKKMVCVWNKLTYGNKSIAKMLPFFNIFHSSHSFFLQVLCLSMNLNQMSHECSKVDLVKRIPNLHSSWIANSLR